MVSEKEFALDFAKRAGAIMRKNFHSNMKKQWKEDNSPVTETDLAINRMLIEEVVQHFPDHAVLAEEESNLKAGARYVWVCDPVDGTVPFSHAIPTCVFSLALCDDGAPVLGVIYDPFMDRMFFAEKGKGATLNGAPTHVSKAASLQRAVISAYPYTEFIDGMALVKELDKHSFIVDPWSITYMGMLIASGDVVATIFQGKKSHDTAAMKIIIEEAGGKVTDLFGNEQRYDREIKGHIASNGVLHEELVALAKKHAL